MTTTDDCLILSIAATSAVLVCVPAPISWAIAVPTLPLMTYLEIHELRTRPLEPATVWYCLSLATILIGVWIGPRLSYGLLYFAVFVLMNGVVRTWLKIEALTRRLIALLIALIEGAKLPEFLWKDSIRIDFLKGIETAKTRIDIESPWIAPDVLNVLLKPLEAVLKKGVRVRIVYGFPGNGPKELLTQQIAANLQKLWKGYDFKMKHGKTHIKSFICDDDFVLVGSFNFLSFSGVFDKGTRSEMVVKIRDKKAIDSLRARAFDF